MDTLEVSCVKPPNILSTIQTVFLLYLILVLEQGNSLLNTLKRYYCIIVETSKNICLHETTNTKGRNCNFNVRVVARGDRI